MSQLAEEQDIEWNSPLYLKTLEIFHQNILDVVLWAEKENIPVMIGTVASNVRDQKPYVSIHRTEKNEIHFDKQIELIRSLMINSEFERALSEIEDLLKMDPTYALLNFYAGRCCEFLSKYDQARLYYENARDYDGLRFRASSDLNDRIRQLKSYSNVFVSEVEDQLIHTDKHGLIGMNFMLEHLHPNEEGNIIIANSFFQTMIKYDILNLGHQNKTEKVELGMTSLDRSIAKYRIKILTSGWPFSSHNRYITTANLQQNSKSDSVAVEVLQNKKSYWEAHIEMADYYRQLNEPENAIQEYKTLVRSFPNVWKSQKAIAEYYIDLNQYDDALYYLKQGIELDGDTYCYKMAGSILLQKNQPDEALPYLLIACDLSPIDPQARYNLSGAYYMLGEVEKAKDELRIIMDQNPEYHQAKVFFDQLH